MAVNLPKILNSGDNIVVCIDPSGSHMAYSVCSLDFDSGIFTVNAAGMIWTKGSYDRPDRLQYMQGCLTRLIQYPPIYEYAPNLVVTEAYFSNPKMLTGGTAIIPTINCFIEMLAKETNSYYQEIGASTWRSILNIKPDKTPSGVKDFKTPVKRFIQAYTNVPETIPSNIDLKLRKTPTDLYDVLGMSLAVAKYYNMAKVDFANTWNYPYSYLLAFSQIVKGSA